MKKSKEYSQYCSQTLKKKNVVGVGLGHKEVRGKATEELCMVVLVNKKLPLSQLKKEDTVPRNYGSYVTDVQEIGDIKLLTSNSNGLDKRRSRMRPAMPGTSIAHYSSSAGTLGAVVTDKDTSEIFILSNNHVLANVSDGRDGKAQKGDYLYQPGPFDGGTEEDLLAKLDRFIPLYLENSFAPCPLAVWVEKVVNAVVRKRKYQVRFFKLLNKGNLVDAALGRPIEENMVSPEIFGLGEVTGTAEAQIGEMLYKSGRTTGITSGIVKVLDASVWVHVSLNSRMLMEEQIIAEPMGEPGDSGSLVLNKDNKGVGLLMAGSDQATIMNKMSNVETLLNVQL